MNIDTLLIDLEIIGQIKDNDKLAVSNVVGSTKLFVNQYSLVNCIYRRYNGYNRLDSIVYLENLIARVETASIKIIDGNFTDMSLSLKTSIEKAISGISNLKLTYINDSEIIARLTICNNKIVKVFENLKEFNDTMNHGSDDFPPNFNDINITTNNNSSNNIVES
tara:strand:- start:4877 stop:5371 length:495 start_codon:yes stop_codon:yes gene_type:complete